jgi:hypothetical protein
MQPVIKRSFVNAVRLERDRVPDFRKYPFCIPTDTEHYQITKDFLNRHERMLEILLSEEEKDLKSKERKR